MSTRRPLFSGLADPETCLAGQVGRCSRTDVLAAKSQIKLPRARRWRLAPLLAGSLGEDLFPLGQEMWGGLWRRPLPGRMETLEVSPPCSISARDSLGFLLQLLPFRLNGPGVPWDDWLRRDLSSTEGHGDACHWDRLASALLST